MNTTTRCTATWRALLAVALAAAAIAGCGGGVGTGGTGGNATAYASGPITGFGSVIVNGVRFDDSAPSLIVEDGDGVSGFSRDVLRLGMTVEVDSSAITTDASGSSASATRIRFDSEMTGLVGSVDVTGGSFTLLGQRVTVDAATVFDDRLNSGGLVGLLGQAVEVYAVFDTVGTTRYRATRIEQASLTGGLRLRGPLAQVDTTARTLRVGLTTYSYINAIGIPASLAADQFVRLRLGLVTQPIARWEVLSFSTALHSLPDADDAKVEGLITSFTSASAFAVSGRPVDASAATFPNGAAGLAAGVRVEVEGTLRSGVLRASEVSIVSDDEVRDRGFELHGAITAVTLTTITLRGLTVSTARTDLRFDDGGTVAGLLVGRCVEVKGVLAADRRTLEATRIRFRSGSVC